jgi:hypothetical protein
VSVLRVSAPARSAFAKNQPCGSRSNERPVRSERVFRSRPEGMMRVFDHRGLSPVFFGFGFLLCQPGGDFAGMLLEQHCTFVPLARADCQRKENEHHNHIQERTFEHRLWAKWVSG